MCFSAPAILARRMPARSALPESLQGLLRLNRRFVPQL